METARHAPRVTKTPEVTASPTTEPQTTPALLEVLQLVEAAYREMP
jgi:hypothetical protein